MKKEHVSDDIFKRRQDEPEGINAEGNMDVEQLAATELFSNKAKGNLPPVFNPKAQDDVILDALGSKRST